MTAFSSLSKHFFASCCSRLTSPIAHSLKAEPHSRGPSLPFAASSVLRHVESASQSIGNSSADLHGASQPQRLPVDVGLQAARRLLPGTTPYSEALMQPFVQQHVADRDAAEEKIYKNVINSCSPQPLLNLPDEALRLVASHLPPTCTAQLQKTCRHMYTLLDEDRLWQDKLRTLHPYWAAAGIQPTADLQHGHTWKQLLLSAGQLRNHEGFRGDPHATNLVVRCTTQTVWATGSAAQMDFQLCWAEYQSARASLNNAVQVQLVTFNINCLLDLVHFLWFDQRQLARGAVCLAKATTLLADHFLSPDALQLQHSGSDVTAAASAAGAYLVELLEMRVWQHTIMTIRCAHGFHQACKALSRGREVTIATSEGPTFDWSGSEYSWADLRGALGVVAGLDTQPADLIPSQQQDPLHPATWRLLNPQALSLLEALNGTANAAQDVVQGNLGQQASGSFKDAVSLPPYDACRAHHKHAGATLLARMASAWNWWEVACAHARMWLAAEQPLRAAHIAKMCLMQLPDNGDGSAWALECATEAYYQHWKQTGTANSCSIAMAWLGIVILDDRADVTLDSPPAVVHRLFGPRLKVIELLQDRTCMATLSLTSKEAQLLVVGACASALWRAGCADLLHDLLSQKINVYNHIVDTAKAIFHVHLRSLFQSTSTRWEIKQALTWVPCMKPAFHQIAAAELAQKSATAEFLVEADAAPFAKVLLESMQSLHDSVSG